MIAPVSDVPMTSSLPWGTSTPSYPPALVDRPSAHILRRRREFSQLAQCIGTGGSVGAATNYTLVFASGDTTVVVVGQGTKGSAPMMLREIKAFLVPQIKDLAPVLKVKRQSVYAWLKGENVSPENMDRIKEIHALVLLARASFAGVDRKKLEAALISSPISDLLRQERPEPAQVETQIRILETQLKNQPIPRVARKHVDLQETARRVGAPDRHDRDSRIQQQILTGKGYVLEAVEE